MIYSINESTKSDEFIKTMPKKVPATLKDVDEKASDKRFSDWHKMSDKEKQEVLSHINAVSDRKRDDQISYNKSKGKYYNANHTNSIKVKYNDEMVPNRIKRSTNNNIFECVNLI